MTEGKLRKWIRKFKDGWENVHEEERLHQPSLWLLRIGFGGNDMLVKSLLEVKHGSPILPLNPSKNRWNSYTQPFVSRLMPNKHCQSVKLWHLCSGAGAVFADRLYAPRYDDQSMSTAKLLRSSEEHFKTKGTACCQKEFYSSTMDDLTLLTRLGLRRILYGDFWAIHHTALNLLNAISTFFSFSNVILAEIALLMK